MGSPSTSALAQCHVAKSSAHTSSRKAPGPLPPVQPPSTHRRPAATTAWQANRACTHARTHVGGRACVCADSACACGCRRRPGGRSSLQLCACAACAACERADVRACVRCLGRCRRSSLRAPSFGPRPRRPGRRSACTHTHARTHACGACTHVGSRVRARCTCDWARAVVAIGQTTVRPLWPGRRTAPARLNSTTCVRCVHACRRTCVRVLRACAACGGCVRWLVPPSRATTLVGARR